MGTDKAFILIDGVPMVQRVVVALRQAGARRVLVVGGDIGRLSAAGLDVVPDAEPGQGPLAGLVTALRSLEGPTVLLPCDLVTPDPVSIGRLASALGAEPAADVALPRSEPGEPIDVLFAAWRSTALEPAQRLLAAGVRAPRAILPDLMVTEVDGLSLASRADADRPEELPGHPAR
jgi:molybdopterin-guanine dinucleotide biosynthesis protein A